MNTQCHRHGFRTNKVEDPLCNTTAALPSPGQNTEDTLSHLKALQLALGKFVMLKVAVESSTLEKMPQMEMVIVFTLVVLDLLVEAVIR